MCLDTWKYCEYKGLFSAHNTSLVKNNKDYLMKF